MIQHLRPAIRAGIALAVVAAGLAAIQLSGGSGAAGPGGPFAYVANHSSGQVSVIDLSTETEATAVATGGLPYWVAISANGATVAASLHNSTGVGLIDGSTNTLIGVVGGVGSEPEAVAVNSSGTTVYVADESGDELYVVNVSSQTVTDGPIDLSGCSEPENMVISPDDAFLYVTCAGSSVIRVATAGFAMMTIDTGLSDPHGIALNPAGTRLYYTDGTDVLEWNTGTQGLTGTTFLGCNMYFGAVSPDGSRLYCKKEFGDLNVYATSDGSSLGSVSTGGDAVAVSPDGARAYVPVGGVVEVVDTASVADLPGDIAMSGTGGRGIAIGPPPAEPTPTATSLPTEAAATPPPPTGTVAAAALPQTGTGGSSNGPAQTWLIAAVGSAALLAAGGYAALRIRTRRS